MICRKCAIQYSGTHVCNFKLGDFKVFKRIRNTEFVIVAEYGRFPLFPMNGHTYNDLISRDQQLIHFKSSIIIDDFAIKIKSDPFANAILFKKKTATVDLNSVAEIREIDAAIYSSEIPEVYPKIQELSRIFDKFGLNHSSRARMPNFLSSIGDFDSVNYHPTVDYKYIFKINDDGSYRFYHIPFSIVNVVEFDPILKEILNKCNQR